MDESPFARLSPELRNKIYDFTFTSKSRLSLGPRSGPNNATHPLVRSCRQMRSEALPMYFSQARYSVHLDDGPTTPLVKWFQAIGPKACLLIHEIDVFDLHNHMLTLWSTENAESAFAESPRKNVAYRATGVGSLDKNNIRFNSGMYISQLQPALREIGLDLRQGYEVYLGNGKEEFNGYCSWFVLTDANHAG